MKYIYFRRIREIFDFVAKVGNKISIELEKKKVYFTSSVVCVDGNIIDLYFFLSSLSCYTEGRQEVRFDFMSGEYCIIYESLEKNCSFKEEEIQ